MFDISFTELLVVAVIALFVIGPERLPQTVKEVSLWIGRLKRSLRETRQELEKQIGADEIRRTLHNENVMQQLNHIKQDVEDTLNKDLIADDSKENKIEPHDSNNSGEDSLRYDENGRLINDTDAAQTEQKNTAKKATTTATVTAESLISGEMPFETAVESATKNAVQDQQTESDSAADSELKDNDSTSEPKPEQSISGKSRSNHADSDHTAST